MLKPRGRCVTDRFSPPGVLIAYEGLPLHLALFPRLWTELSQSQVTCPGGARVRTWRRSLTLCFSQSVLAKTCVKLLCEDPAFSEYLKCVLMDERSFLNNNVAYSFLTCFLHKVGRRGPTCGLLSRRADPCVCV